MEGTDDENVDVEEEMCKCEHSDEEVSSSTTSLVFLNPNLRVGFHVHKSSTYERTFERLLDSPLRAYQILCCARAYKPPGLDVIDIMRARQVLEENGKYLCIHGNLIYNLCGSVQYKADPQFERKLDGTVTGLTGELDLGVGLGAGVVVHIGACVKRAEGLAMIAKTINHVLTVNTEYAKKVAKAMGISVVEVKKRRKVILENAAGEGNKLGSTLEDIAEIFSQLDKTLVSQGQVKVCIDTAHIFGAGQYDFGLPDEVDRFYKSFDKLIGLDKLEVIHLNDSRVEFNSRKDRHENLCLGYIWGDREDGLDGSIGLTKFLEEAVKRKIVLIGEPPAKTADGEPGPGGIHDYEVIKRLVAAEHIC